MRPAVEWLYRHGLSRPIGIIAIYILIAAILVGFLALFVPLIVDQTTLIFQNLPQYQLTFRETLLASHNLILRNIGSRVPAKIILFGNDKSTTREVLNQVNQTFNYVNLTVKGVLSVLAVFLLAYY